MAFRSNGPTMLALPAFRGVTRRIILICLVTFFVFWMVSSFVQGAGLWLVAHFALTPAFVFRGQLWQLLSYAIFPLGLIGEFFALLSVWFIGTALEDELGSGWLREYFFASTLGGALFASAFALLSGGRAFGIHELLTTVGLYPFIMALLLAYARFNAEQEILLFFVLRIKAKYLAAVYLLYYLGSTILGGDRFGALTAVCSAMAGWLYLRFVPRRGLGFSATERWYSVRNAFYRNKRQRAAKKFQVYMRKQGRDVHFDANGKFLEEDQADPAKPRNANDRRWMN